MATLLSYALCTVADVKESLAIASSDTSWNNLITRQINNATRIIENYCGRRFKETSYTEDYSGTATNELILRNRPVSSITSLQLRDTSLNEDDFTTIETDAYFVDLNQGILSATGSFSGGNNMWRVTYTAGYPANGTWPDGLPEDIREAAAILASYLTLNPTGAGNGIKSMREGQRQIEYQQQTGQGSLIEQLGLDNILDFYREPILTGTV